MDSKKRNRPSLVCSVCKRKKIRCDRARPCNHCKRSGLTHMCSYDSNWVPPERTVDYKESARTPIASSATKVSPRVMELDGMVLIGKQELVDLQEKVKRLENENKKAARSTVNSNPQKVFLGDERHPAWNMVGDTVVVSNHNALKPGIIGQKTTTNISRQNLVGLNPYQDELDVLPVYESDNHTAPAHSPFSWHAFHQKDLWMKALVNLMKTEKIFLKSTNLSKSEPTELSDHIYASVILHRQDLDPTKEPLSDKDQPKRAFELKMSDEIAETMPYGKRDKHNYRLSVTLGLTFNGGPVEEELRLIGRIVKALPKQRVIWELVDRFFAIIYPYAPFLDEREFRDHLARIIGPERNDVHLERINIESKIDLAHMGILLVVIRTSYLSLFNNRSSVNNERLTTTSTQPEAQLKKYLLLNPIMLMVMELAQLCLLQFQMLKQASFPVFQCALYIHLYHTLAPEGGEGILGQSLRVFNGTLVQMALALGLHHDPDDYMPKDRTPEQEREAHLRRKIWTSMLATDLCRCFIEGIPLIINHRFYTTKFPYIKPGSENLVNVAHDHAITNNFYLMELFCLGPATEFLELISVSRYIKIADVTKYLNVMELTLYLCFGRLTDYIQPLESNDANYAYGKIQKGIILFSLRASFLLLYYHLFLYYEGRKNWPLSFGYLSKVVSIIAEEVIPSMLPVIFEAESCFGEGADFILNPAINDLLFRCSHLVVALIARVTHSMREINVDSEESKNLRLRVAELSLYLVKIARIFLACANILSNRCFLAWKLTKTLPYLLKLVLEDELYESMEMKLPLFSSTQTRYLILMCDNGLKVLDKLRQQNFQNINLEELLQEQENDQVVQPPHVNLAATTQSDIFPTDFNELDLVDLTEVDLIWMSLLTGLTMKHRPDNMEMPKFPSVFPDWDLSL